MDDLKTEAVRVRLTVDERAALRAMANGERMTLSNALRLALKEAVQRRGYWR